jgi:hypothetical protein
MGLFKWNDDDCGKVKDIKTIHDIVDFTGSKFYVRKEVLCVLENFKKMYQSELDGGKVVNTQFIITGSPGIGKSCILALLLHSTPLQTTNSVAPSYCWWTCWWVNDASVLSRKILPMER